MAMRSNFPPKGPPWRLPRSTTKPQRRFSLSTRLPRSATTPQPPFLLWKQPGELIMNGGPPPFIRFRRPTILASVADDLDAHSAANDVDQSLTASSSPPCCCCSSSSSVVNRSVADNRSTPSPQLKHDVFISFRGPDSRDGFVSHLYDDLTRAGLETFIDSEKLKAGQEIAPALSDAIEHSRISVVVFTKEYASSKWCLRELAKIMECNRTRGQTVLPIFLGVLPMEVRWQAGCFSVAFSKHDKAPEGSQLAKEVKLWRDAMSQAANISGFDSTAVRPASTLVDEIVERILEKLEETRLCEDEGLVGAYRQVKEVEELLEYGSDEVRSIGIYGLGGSGKTTLAGAVFNRVCQKFDSSCFLANLREESKRHGLTSLRNELLRQILGQTDINIATPDIGSANIRDRLRRRRVLVVIDDVCSITQLEFLIKQEQPSYFGPGSRIIITTRDMNVIKNIDHIYSVKGLSDSDSLELFSRCAFKQSYPPEEYLQLSMRAFRAKGLPLALKVLGSFLFKKSPLEWESAFRRLDSFLDEDLFSVLRVSYDGLSDEEKTTFLDLACFFNGEQRSYVAALLDGCGISADIGIRTLVDKCMITLSNDTVLHMHHLLQKMGRQIVMQESPGDPTKRSRLWSFEEIHELLTENTGTISTEGISLDLSGKEELQISSGAFTQMRNLKFLRIYYKESNEESCKTYFPEGLEYLPKLRLLYWEKYPLEYLPVSFCPDNLVELRMRDSRLECLWTGVKSLCNLKGIDLSHSRYLKELPDLSNALNLERIVAIGCVDLVVIPSPKDKLESLEILDLSGCSKVKEFPEISWNVKKLLLAGSGIEEIPLSIKNFHQLVELDMKGCKMLKNVAQIGQKLERLEFVDLSGCSRVASFPNLSCNVVVLFLNETAIEEIPSSSIKFMRKLELLEMNKCLKLTSLPSNICELKSLVKLNMSGCANFTSFPEITEIMSSLKYLSLKGTAIRKLPSSLKNLIGLCSINLENCKSLISLPDFSESKFLEDLNISGCTNLDNLPGSIKNLGSLVNVRASGCKSKVVGFLRSGSSSLKILDLSDCGIREFPETLTASPTLTELDLSQNCFSNIPASIKDLQELKSLDLSRCHELQSLSGVPDGLTRLNVLNCKSLETVALGNSTELQLYPLNNVETFVFAGCPSLIQSARDNIEAFAKRRIYVLASHLGVILNFRGDNLSLNCWMKPHQLRYLLSSMYRYGNLHEALIGLHTAFFRDEQILEEPESRLLGRILHDFHERYRLDVQGLLHFFSLIAHLYLYYQGKPSTNFCLPADDIPDWFFHQSNGSFTVVMIQPSKHSQRSSTLAGFAISVLVAFENYNDDKGINIKYECHFHYKKFGIRDGAGYLRGWDKKKGKPLSIEGDHLFMGFDSSILSDAANGIEQYVEYSEDLVQATFQYYVVDEDGKPIKSCTVKKCAVQPLYTSDVTKSPKEILSRQDITEGFTTSFSELIEKVLLNVDLYGAVSLGILNVIGNLSVDVVDQEGYVFITTKCENAGLPIGLQILNVHLGTAPLSAKLVEMSKESQDPRAFSIEFSDVEGDRFGCRIKVKKCEFRPLQSHVMLLNRSAAN